MRRLFEGMEDECRPPAAPAQAAGDGAGPADELAELGLSGQGVDGNGSRARPRTIEYAWLGVPRRQSRVCLVR